MSAREQQELANGTRFGPYEIVRLLGSGGFGSVYEGRHLALEKRVALKTLHRQMAAKPEAAARFVREGKAAARIRHPHVVDVSDVGTHDGLPYLVMEFLEGEDLSQMIRREGAQPIERVVDFMLPVISAVAAAHDAGVIHRDIKPENIFLVRGRMGLEPKVLDFGISKVMDAVADFALTGTQAVLGTPSYMSPEQTTGSKSVDQRTDQYALGVILFECVTAHKPFDGPSLFALMSAIVQGDVAPMNFFANVPDSFEAVVRTAMHRESGLRFPAVRMLGNRLLPFASARARAYWESEFGAAVPPVSPVQTTTYQGHGQAPVWNGPQSVPSATPSGTPTSIPPPSAYPSGPARPTNTPASTSAPHVRAHQDTLTESAAALSGDLARGRSRSTLPFVLGGLALVGLSAGVFIVARGGHNAASIDQPATLRTTTSAPQALTIATPATPVAPPQAVSPPVNTPPNTVVQLAAPATVHVRIAVTPIEAAIQLDGTPVAIGHWESDIPRDGSQHHLTLSATGFEPQVVTFSDQSPLENVSLVPVPVHNAPAAARPAVATREAPVRTAPARQVHPAAAPSHTTTTRGANHAPIVE